MFIRLSEQIASDRRVVALCFLILTAFISTFIFNIQKHNVLVLLVLFFSSSSFFLPSVFQQTQLIFKGHACIIHRMRYLGICSFIMLRPPEVSLYFSFFIHTLPRHYIASVDSGFIPVSATDTPPFFLAVFTLFCGLWLRSSWLCPCLSQTERFHPPAHRRSLWQRERLHPVAEQRRCRWLHGQGRHSFLPLD